MAEIINYGGTPGFVDNRTPQERIVQSLKYKLAEAEAGKVEAFWSIDIQRRENGDPVPTLTIIIDETGNEEQREVIHQHLWGIADVLRELYRK